VSEILSAVFLVSLLAATLRLATPLILAGLGELFSERAGVLNIGIEGMMLLGSLVGFLCAFWAKNPWLGLLAGVGAGTLLALVSGYLSISLGADQIVTGLGINIFAAGLAGVLYRFVFGISAQRTWGTPLPEWPIPILGDLPILGPVFFRQVPLVYLAFALVPVAWWVLFRTPFGLRVRAVGEHPLAGATAGVDVIRIRYGCVLLAGAMAGLAGSFLSVGQMNMFFDNMTAGRGFIALAAVIFGRWMPVGTMAAALLFGWADALQLRLQVLGFKLPHQILLMLPYLATMVVLAGAVGRARLPAALGVPYRREAT
jgi:simple sugar transport system permease protein